MSTVIIGVVTKQKVATIVDAGIAAQKAREQQQRVVLVTGVFDLLHQEHKSFLRKAHQQGDVLLVGVESDIRVRQLKGSGRPYQSQTKRVKNIEALGIATVVFVLPEQFDRPADHEALIAAIRPYILAVSAHTPHLEEKQRILQVYGGQVMVVHEHNPTVSTTKLLQAQQLRGKFRAVLVDVDGTLVKSDLSISPRVKTAIEKAQQAGVLVGVCTGRQFVTLTTVFNWIGWQGLHVVAGGAEVVDANTREVVWSEQLSSQDVRWLYQEVIGRGGDVVIGKPEALYTYESFVKHLHQHPWQIPGKEINELGDDWSSPLVSIHHINPEVEEFLITQDRFHAVRMVSQRSGVLYYDVTAHGVTKKLGVDQWSKKTQIPLSEVIAIGDGMNDVELFEMVGKAVAVDNAIPVIKEMADMVVASNQDDGVAEVLEALV